MQSTNIGTLNLSSFASSHEAFCHHEDKHKRTDVPFLSGPSKSNNKESILGNIMPRSISKTIHLDYNGAYNSLEI